MNGYERRKQRKIEQIFTAAFDLLMNNGMSRVNVNEIAEKARVSPATIYNYFGTKEQLYVEMLQHWMEQQLRKYEEILYSELPYLEKVSSIMIQESLNLKIVLKIGPLQAANDKVHLARLLTGDVSDKLRHLYMKLIELGKQEGLIPHDVLDETLLRYFQMYIEQFSQLHQDQDSAPTNQLVVDQFIHLFFYGLVHPNKLPEGVIEPPI
ncbi:TetR/AcrR family transcriptional regulator [Paenibacillus sp. YYML68]|uniref:TetR/AcrR family transcriptional regulator n=1 Tax=Paenibacillus sp. YYML68 TaxID=2909250 RepID=UPI002490FD56|nr:TetR/AcrR family transcriptional regulator [Paenibacillus sp. YYML68]